MGGLPLPHAHLPRRVSRCCRLAETANMHGYVRRCRERTRPGTARYSARARARARTQSLTHSNTHVSQNYFKSDGATDLAPALSRLTGLTTLDLRCAPPRVSDLSRLSRSGTVREMHGEETMEEKGNGAST